MKQATIFFLLFISVTVKSQVYSPQLAGTQGNFNIYYPYGFYFGQTSNGYANGEGYFYWQDGTIFHGYYLNGIANGPGMLISRYGTVFGCWSYGNYMGQCQTQQMYSVNSIVPTLRTVQSNINNTSPQSQTQYSPIAINNYNVTDVDPSTKMGRQIVGSHR